MSPSLPITELSLQRTLPALWADERSESKQIGSAESTDPLLAVWAAIFQSQIAPLIVEAEPEPLRHFELSDKPETESVADTAPLTLLGLTSAGSRLISGELRPETRPEVRPPQVTPVTSDDAATVPWTISPRAAIPASAAPIETQTAEVVEAVPVARIRTDVAPVERNTIPAEDKTSVKPPPALAGTLSASVRREPRAQRAAEPEKASRAVNTFPRLPALSTAEPDAVEPAFATTLELRRDWNLRRPVERHSLERAATGEERVDPASNTESSEGLPALGIPEEVEVPAIEVALDSDPRREPVKDLPAISLVPVQEGQSAPLKTSETTAPASAAAPLPIELPGRELVVPLAPPKAQEVPPAPRVPTPLAEQPLAQAAKVISIRIPLTEAGGQANHIDLVFRTRNNDLTLQFNSPHQEVQRQIQDSIPALVEKLETADWTATKPAAIRAEGATEPLKASVERHPGTAEAFRDIAPAQQSAGNAFRFDENAQGRREQRAEHAERNRKKQAPSLFTLEEEAEL